MKIGSSLNFKVKFPGRLSLLWNFIKGFILLSFLLRLTLFIWQYDEVSWNVFDILHTLVTGLFFDIGTCSFITLPALLYFFIIPNRFIGSVADRVIVYFFFTLTVFVFIFTFFAEITFWDEFHTRFNFIAVDYLIYTFEVIKNIEESYPLPLLIGGIAALTFLADFILLKRKVFYKTFHSSFSFVSRNVFLAGSMAVVLVYAYFVKNSDAEWSANRYNSEISKSGVYSFFGAFRNNQMKYPRFYDTIGDREAFALIRKKLKSGNTNYLNSGFTITRKIVNDTTSEQRPNVVFVLMESMSADFMQIFGNKKGLTPNLDSLAKNGLLFSNLYATGTRTVRGMEAVTLCIPPTPGQSIVKRPDNHDLYTIGTVFKSKGYTNSFFYGGDGYFDNMNSYYGGNGFTIYDRGRGSVLSDDIKTERHNISDSEVTFENAWGICDEDIYNKALKVADEEYARGKPFFNFVMSTSNHRPYTYPDNTVDVPSGSNRDGAVKYADFAIGELIAKAKTKPWFKNTIFIFVADHCASSAGKDEIDIAHHHIPAIIYNLQEQSHRQITEQCSQIDIFPTLFALLQWDYRSDFFGQNVLGPEYRERALLGTYRKLALLKKNKVMILSDQKKHTFYDYNIQDNSLVPAKEDKAFLDETISWYQTADYLFTNKGLKEKAVVK